MSREIYLDHNATTKPSLEVRSAVAESLGDNFGNPSSSHGAGDRARTQLRQARHAVSELVGVDPAGLIFTSSGTEANNTVLLAAADHPRHGRGRVVTATTEHSSVLKVIEPLRRRGVEVVALPVDRGGRLDLERAEHEITDATTLVSVQWVNNETGVIQPIEALAAICGQRGVLFHTDAAQACGKLRMNVAELGIDFVTLSAHKIHGPQGVGAVYAKHPAWLTPLFFGGPQEGDARPGTENVPGIVGFGKAAEIRARNLVSATAALCCLRDQFERRVFELVPNVSINGDPQHRVGNTSNLRFAGVDGQALVARLDQRGIRCSQSSACTNQRPEPSYVLRAMGLSEDAAYASVRFSFGVENTPQEIDIVVDALRDICQQLRSFSSRIQNPYHVART